MDAGRYRLTCPFLPVDQGIEHSGGASFAKNPEYFDAENIVKLAIEGGCNAVASTFGVLGAVSRKYAHKIPFLVKINHNELMTLPTSSTRFCSAPSGKPWIWARPRWAQPFTSDRIQHAADRRDRPGFRHGARSGIGYRVGWCYLRNSGFKTKEKDYHVAADLTGQANHLGVTIQADIIKQKLPENNGGFPAMNVDGKSYGKYDKRMYTDLCSDHPIDLCRYQVLNCLHGPRRIDSTAAALRAPTTSPRR